MIKESSRKYKALVAILLSSFLVGVAVWLYCTRSFIPQKIVAYHEIQAVFDSCDPKTLVTFDVDDTLITTADVAGRNLECSLWFKLCAALTHPSLIFSEQKHEFFASVMLQQAHHFVFDPDVIRLIKQLQRQGCKVVALSGIGSGDFGLIKNVPEWRAHMLAELGIDLRDHFENRFFDELPMHHGLHPFFYKGILCTNHVAKGEVLGAFIDSYPTGFARVISFDNSADALRSIAYACAWRAIPFVGYQMIGVRRLPGRLGLHRALIQLDYVMRYSRWLSDQEAEVLLARSLYERFA